MQTKTSSHTRRVGCSKARSFPTLITAKQSLRMPREMVKTGPWKFAWTMAKPPRRGKQPKQCKSEAWCRTHRRRLSRLTFLHLRQRRWMLFRSPMSTLMRTAMRKFAKKLSGTEMAYWTPYSGERMYRQHRLKKTKLGLRAFE